MRKALQSKGEGRSGGREVSDGGGGGGGTLAWEQSSAEIEQKITLILLSADEGDNPAYLTLVCRCTYRLWKLLVLSVRPKLGPCSLWMISAFITRAMWAGSSDNSSRSWR